MNLILIHAVTLSFLITWSGATTVQFNNKCPDNIDLQATEAGQDSKQICNLDSGANCVKDYDSKVMRFQNGKDAKATIAEFAFNQNNQDVYDLSVVDGYNTAMQITSSNGGPTVTCTDANCPDAINTPDDDALQSTTTGGTFNVNFCP